MGRYRPPEKRGSPYITPEGLNKLELELKSLWKKRAHVTRILSAAAAEGDRSENAEYIYRKKQLREMDRRIRYLQKRLDELIAVNSIPGDLNRVFFGAWVELEDAEGNVARYRIVGPDEFDVKKSYISMDSPIAQGIMKKTLDDEVTIALPGGSKTFMITGIDYNSSENSDESDSSTNSDA